MGENVEKCRCCMTVKVVNELRPIFKFGKICGQTAKLADMLQSITNLNISENDGLPARICDKCAVHVFKSYAFKQQCIKSEEQLRQPLWRQPSPTEVEFQMDFDNSLSEMMECESSKQPVELITLNDDCLLHILRLVSLVDLCNVRDTCTRLRPLADQSFRLYRCKSLEIQNGNIFTGFFVLKHFGQYIESLSLDTFYNELNVFETVASKEYECLKTVLKNVHSIALNNFYDITALEQLLNYCENLKDVTIWNDEFYVKSDWLLRNPNVTKLTLDGLGHKNLKEIISRSKGLECLIAKCVTDDVYESIDLNRFSSTLKELRVAPADVMIEQDLQKFADKTILKVVTLEFSVVSELLADVLGDFPNLSDLTFSNVDFVENALDILSKRLVRIESLRFIECGNVTFAAVLKIHRNQLDLKNRSLYDCDEIEFIDRPDYLSLQKKKNLQVFLDRRAYDLTCVLLGNDRLDNVQLKPLESRFF